jgi:diguanylate cyclase (GGDEF)-like protein
MLESTQAKEFEAQLQYLAHHHPLTKLPNRLVLNARLNNSLSLARRSQSKLAILFIDLDRFKQINDSLGHAVGDLVLKQAAERFQQVVRSTDTVAHLGGDEFVILLEQITEPRNAAAIATKILNLLSYPLVFSDLQVSISASIGISLFPDDSDNALDLLKNADTAMYRSKKNGGNTYHFYTEDTTTSV